MKKEVIVGIVSIVVLLVLVLRTNFSSRDNAFEPKTYYLTDFPEKDLTEQRSKIQDESTIPLEPKKEKDIIKDEEKDPIKNLEDTSYNKKDTNVPLSTEAILAGEVQHKKSSKRTNPVDKKQKHQPIFKIQLFVSYQQLPPNSKLFKGLSPVKFYQVNNIYKYTYGSDTNYDKIKRLKESKVDDKFKDAFIIAFQNGEKINLEEAINASNKSLN